VKTRMDALVQNSRGMIIATHNTDLMKSLCTHGIVLEEGKMVFCGNLQAALECYEEQGAK